MNTSSTNPPRQPFTVVIAGAAGDLGGRITEHLVKRGASVRTLQRLDASEEDRERIEALGATPVGVNTSTTSARSPKPVRARTAWSPRSAGYARSSWTDNQC